MTWWQEGLNGCDDISSHYTQQLITAHRGAVLTEGPAAPAEACLMNRVEVAMHASASLFTDEPLEEPTAPK